MRPLLASIRKEFLALSRDVHGLLVLFVMPAVFILVMSLALRDTFQPNISEKVRWAAWDADANASSAAVLARLPPPADLHARSRGALEEALARGKIQVGVVIAPGFAEALTDLENRSVFVSLLAEPGMPPGLVAAFRAELERALVAERVALLLRPLEAGADGAEADAAIPPVEEIAALGPLLETSFPRASRAELTSVQQSVPAWLVFAMFFVVIPLSTIFIAEKQQGTLPRLRSLRVPAWVLLLGKVVPFHLINLGQTAVMLLVGRHLVPLIGGDALRLDCDWLALWAIASAVSLAAIGFALALATLARTTEQATTIGGVANILFGALGGVMVPKLVMPAGMQQATLFSPMAWGLDGFVDVFVRGAHAGDLGGPLAALLGMALLGFGVAWWRLRRLS